MRLGELCTTIAPVSEQITKFCSLPPLTHPPCPAQTHHPPTTYPARRPPLPRSRSTSTTTAGRACLSSCARARPSPSARRRSVSSSARPRTSSSPATRTRCGTRSSSGCSRTRCVCVGFGGLGRFGGGLGAGLIVGSLAVGSGTLCGLWPRAEPSGSINIHTNNTTKATVLIPKTSALNSRSKPQPTHPTHHHPRRRYTPRSSSRSRASRWRRGSPSWTSTTSAASRAW